MRKTVAEKVAAIEPRKLPHRLRTQRLALGLTQKDIAERTGLTIATVGRHETEQRRVCCSDLLVYAKALECTPMDLVDTRSEREIDTAWRRREEAIGALQQLRENLTATAAYEHLDRQLALLDVIAAELNT